MKRTIIIFPMLVLATALFAADKPYGSAEVKKGEATVVRDGNNIVIAKNDKKQPIFLEDIVIVGENSELVLKTAEATTLTLGSNAMFEVKPWKSQEKAGSFRMLYGRFHAKTRKAFGRKTRFTAKTATATIGVKGTEFIASVTPQGDALVLVKESVVEVSGFDGKNQDVAPELLTVVLNGKGASEVALVPQAVKDISGNLDAPSVNSEEAKALPAENALVQNGIVSQRDLINAKIEQGRFSDTNIIEGEKITPLKGGKYNLPAEIFEDALRPQVLLPRLG